MQLYNSYTEKLYNGGHLSVVTVRFNTTIVRDDESAGSLTFILETNRPADESFTVQVCTEDIDMEPDLGMATGNHNNKMCS